MATATYYYSTYTSTGTPPGYAPYVTVSVEEYDRIVNHLNKKDKPAPKVEYDDDEVI